MYTALSPGVVGVRPTSLEQAIQYAVDGGFQGLELDLQMVAKRVAADGISTVKELFAESGIIPAGWGLPTTWRGEEEPWKEGVRELAEWAKLGSKLGATRTFTWITPSSNERTKEENVAFHIQRFAPIAKVLADHGCSIGLEFIGPKTSRSGRFEFIYQMGEMLELARQIGPNAGLLLDCWHWYTSEATVEDIEKLNASDVVYVHVNDAPEGIDVLEQIDSRRALPAETGVIDAKGFLGALRTIGYDGPMVPEPFKKELSELPSDADRVRVVGDSMQRMLNLAQ